MSSALAKSSPDKDKRLAVSPSTIPLFRVVIFCALGLSGFLADILTKSYIFARYYHPYQPPQQYWWIEGILGIETHTNPGALFGMFPGQRWLFAALSMLALVGIVAWLFVFRGARDPWLNISFGLVTGGILGNLYDRMGFGYKPTYPIETQFNVRDWIYFRLEGVPWFDPWPNFNIADSLLVCGAILLVLHSIFGSRSTVSARETTAAD